jgi:hypothetical protein
MRYFLALSTLIISSAGAYAGEDAVAISAEQVPTLGEWGMIAMVAVIGIAGFFALRKRLQQAKQQ